MVCELSNQCASVATLVSVRLIPRVWFTCQTLPSSGVLFAVALVLYSSTECIGSISCVCGIALWPSKIQRLYKIFAHTTFYTKAIKTVGVLMFFIYSYIVYANCSLEYLIYLKGILIWNSNCGIISIVPFEQSNSVTYANSIKRE